MTETATITAKDFLARLHRGGRYAYLWGVAGKAVDSEGKPIKTSAWYSVGDDLPKHDGDLWHHTYVGVHPTAVLPTNGRLIHRRSVAVSKEDGGAPVAVVNALFAEFDDKDHGGDHASLWADVIDILNPPPSVVIDSGGGYHCYWLLSEPFLLTTDADRKRARRAQYAWVDLVGSDPDAKDLARVLRLPGTLNHKYDPPRPVRFLTVDLERDYSLEELEAYLPKDDDKGDAPKVTINGEPLQGGPRPPIDVQAEIPKAMLALSRLHPDRANGYGDWVNIGMALSGFGAVGLQLWEAWSSQDPKYKPGECAEKWKSFTPGSEMPDGKAITLASLYHFAKVDGGNGNGKGSSQDAPRCAGFLTLGAVAEAAGNLTWAWTGHIASAQLNMLVAPVGVGKSYNAAHHIGVWTGAIPKWPDGSACEQRGPVVLVETEGFRGEWARRLISLGVPRDAVLFPTDYDADAFYVADLLRDLDAIADLVTQNGAVALVIDSLSGAHSLDENSADMRQVLKGLAQLAGELAIPVEVVHHLRKRNVLERDSGRASVDRIRGSSTVAQYCRVITGLWRVDDDPDTPVRAEVIKTNLGKPPPPYGFTITEAGLKFCAAPEAEKPMTQTDKAIEFLRAHLQTAPKTPKQLVELAEQQGISRNTLYRAREKLSIPATGSTWSLPVVRVSGGA